VRQLEAVRQAEQLQKQQYSHLRPPQTREQWIAAVMQQSGTTQAEAEFLLDHPQMMYQPKALSKALADITAQGLQRDDSPEFFQAVKERFGHHVERRQQKAARKASEQPTPEFFQPPVPPPEPPAEQTQSAIFSAPVSRQVGSGGGYQPSLSSVRLTQEQQQIARASGISDTEYARQKLRMLQAQQAGIIQK
jgi:hypothetical protein